MTVAASEIAGALRWAWIFVGALWIAYAWLHRVAYTRVLSGLIGLFALDWALHFIADFVERPDSNLPSDFSFYSLVMLVAAGAGIFVACAYARRRGMNGLTVLYAALLCAGMGALAGRAYYVWTNWAFFVENTDGITDLSTGGFGIRGAWLAGWLALFLFALVTHTSFWQLADAGALGLALASSIGWYGAHLTHLYYGLAIDETVSSPDTLMPLASRVRALGFEFVQDLPDAYNVIALRIPVQLMESIFFMTLFLILLYVALREKSRAQDGSAFVIFLALASAAGFIFGFWRGDTTWMWNGLRIDQWIDLAGLVLALVLAGGRKWFARQRVRAPHAVSGGIQPA